MDTIMHIVYNATKKNSRSRNKFEGIRLLMNSNISELRVVNSVTRRLHVVHAVSVAQVLSSSARTIAEIVRTYEDRIYKRIPKENP